DRVEAINSKPELSFMALQTLMLDAWHLHKGSIGFLEGILQIRASYGLKVAMLRITGAVWVDISATRGLCWLRPSVQQLEIDGVMIGDEIGNKSDDGSEPEAIETESEAGTDIDGVSNEDNSTNTGSESWDDEEDVSTERLLVLYVEMDVEGDEGSEYVSEEGSEYEGDEDKDDGSELSASEGMEYTDEESSE
ncbi:hypothetical protein DXG01_005609, partial [Tephrocybe rancida]